MAEEFDPYKTWLEIDNKSASTTHYKLLGLPEFESDQSRIAAAADKAIRRIRSQRPGEHAAQWSKILDELQEVKSLLLDDQKKAAYDDDLRFADEFVRELEGGMNRDPAAAAIAMVARKSEPRPGMQDPRYPPGMVPKNSSPSPSTMPNGEGTSFRASSEPKPTDRRESPFYPPTRPALDKSSPLAPGPTSNSTDPAPQANAEAATNNILPPGAANSAPDEASTPNQAPGSFSPSPNYAPQGGSYQPHQLASYPQQPPNGYASAPYQQPGGYSQQPSPYQQQPGQYPQHQSPYQQPGYPQSFYPPQGGQAPVAAYPMPQPGYGYGTPMPPPMGYGGPQMTSPYGGIPPMATPMYGVPMAMPMGPQAYMPPPPAPAALDPMAPVAIPGTAMAGGQPNSAPIAMPYGAPMASAAMLQPVSAAIPVGTAVARAGDPPAETPSSADSSKVFNEPAKVVRSSSATSAMLAAKREKSSQLTMMFAGGGLLLIVVAVVGFFAAGGNLGSGPVANNPGKLGYNSPAAIPDKSPSITVPPVVPTKTTNLPVKPDPEKSIIPNEPSKPREPETKPMPEMPAEPKPEPKQEPTKPEPKPEPKSEPKPEMPAGEMPTKEELIQIGKALQTAKAAIGEFNFADADAELAKAEKLAKLPEHRSKLSRLKEVKGLVKQFHDRLVQSAMGMDAASSFKVGTSTIVGMVDADEKQVTLRLTGQNRTYQYSDLPVGLATALADMKLEGSDPVSRVVKGAYVAVHRGVTPDQMQQAKSWWEEATLGGANVTHLMPFLTDSYDLAKDLDKLKQDEAAAKPTAQGESETGVSKAAPDAKAILEGKS